VKEQDEDTRMPNNNSQNLHQKAMCTFTISVCGGEKEGNKTIKFQVFSSQMEREISLN
jgi:hypothetical protein